jgi:formamidase
MMHATGGWCAVLSLSALFLLVSSGCATMGPTPSARIAKTGARCENDPNCHNRWHPAVKPVATVEPGAVVVFETRDALDGQFNRNSKAADVLAITLLDIEPDPFGFTAVVPGFGFLRDLFTNPVLVRWDLNRREATSPDLPGVRVPFNGFMGTIGVAPGPREVQAWRGREAALARAGGVALPPEPKDALPGAVCGPTGSHRDECLRTIPPRENGGNMDIKQMVAGTTLLLPCYVRGCLLSIGDVHYAQGDGEVSGTAIEMAATVTVKVAVRKGLAAFVRQPHFEGGDQLKKLEPSEFYATVGYPIKEAGRIPPTHQYLDGTKIGPLENLSEDVTLAARDALRQMIDWLVKNKGLTAEQAYILSSVAVDLRIGNLVDVPNFAVSAILDLGVFRK